MEREINGVPADSLDGMLERTDELRGTVKIRSPAGVVLVIVIMRVDG